MNDTSSLDIVRIFDLNSFLVGLIIFTSWILLQLDQNKNKNECSFFFFVNKMNVLNIN